MARGLASDPRLMVYGDEAGDTGFGLGGTQYLTVAFVISHEPSRQGSGRPRARGPQRTVRTRSYVLCLAANCLR